MKLKSEAEAGHEIVHFAEGDTVVSSRHNSVVVRRGDEKTVVRLPESILKRTIGVSRLIRRALRLDKCNVVPHGDNLIIIRQGQVWLYRSDVAQLVPTLKLRNCRNVLHQSICTGPDGALYFGEYGANKVRDSVPVYCSRDGGKSWFEIYTFSPGSIKHVHGCFYDKFTDRVWVCTGDFEGENWILSADRDFQDVKKFGDGQQRYRTCNLIFTEDAVHWLMDSQLEPSFHIRFDRKSEEISIGQKMMGPVWYVKELSDGYCLAATAQEIGAGVLDDKTHLYCSNDLKHWETLQVFEHDGLPKRYFKFGVIGFADGMQSSQDFYMFAEAIKGMDGKALKCRLEK